MIRLLLPLAPFGAARTRTRAFPTGRKDRRGRPIFSTQHFMDEKYRAWRELAMPYFERAAPDTALVGALSLSITMLMPFIKSDRRKTHVPRKWHFTKPDGDNIQKSVLDCAEAAGWMKNDSQVSRCVWEKVRAAQGEEPCLQVVVRVLEIPYHLR